MQKACRKPLKNLSCSRKPRRGGEVGKGGGGGGVRRRRVVPQYLTFTGACNAGCRGFDPRGRAKKS